MAGVNLSAIDLNLLVVLDALLAEHSVSRAAKRINSTQPAVSRALGRLRRWFGDPLLTRTRHGMVPTPTGLALTGEVRAVLERIQGFVERRDAFDPARSTRTFRKTMSEYPQYIVCGVLLERIAEAAPGVSVEVLPWSLGFPEALERGR
jgi:DNA-binding transcriptional LysR family regulator